MPKLSQSECICQNPEAWGYTCPVHRTVSRATVPLSNKAREAIEDLELRRNVEQHHEADRTDQTPVADPAGGPERSRGELNRREEIAALKRRIDAMSQFELSKHWRFAPLGDPLFRGEVGDYFRDKLREKGGFTSEISKQLGWSSGNVK